MTNREVYHLSADCDGAFPNAFEDWCFSVSDCEQKESGDVDIAYCQECYERWLDMKFEGGME